MARAFSQAIFAILLLAIIIVSGKYYLLIRLIQHMFAAVIINFFAFILIEYYIICIHDFNKIL